MPAHLKNTDADEVAELAEVGMSGRGIAALVGCDEGVVRRRFAAEVRRGRALRALRIRQAQNAAAEAGNPAVLVWLGKVELGQRERKGDGDRRDVTVTVANAPAGGGGSASS